MAYSPCADAGVPKGLPFALVRPCPESVCRASNDSRRLGVRGVAPVEDGLRRCRLTPAAVEDEEKEREALLGVSSPPMPVPKPLSSERSELAELARAGSMPSLPAAAGDTGGVVESMGTPCFCLEASETGNKTVLVGRPCDAIADRARASLSLTYVYTEDPRRMKKIPKPLPLRTRSISSSRLNSKHGTAYEVMTSPKHHIPKKV